MSDELRRLRDILREELPSLRSRFGVSSLELFGSYLHGVERADSDLDLLVSFSDTPGLFRFIDLENHLGDLLGVKVDLVSRESLKPHIGRRVLSEAVPV